jgi:hypothetical protein
MHNMPVTAPASRPLFTILNNRTYYIGQHANGNGIVKAEVAQADSGYQFKLDMLTPREVTPTEAINYGYNMLKSAPYSFEDKHIPAMVNGQIRLQGILPYADGTCQKLMFNAKVGSNVTFRLIADFPMSDTEQFKFKWELRDVSSDAVTVYDEPNASSKSYHFDSVKGHAVCSDGTDYITLQIQPPYRQCAITVTAFSVSDLTEPVDVIALASYALTADNASTTNQIEVKNYDLTTATGMCTWAQRVVLWGVKGGKNILFVSDINDPSYFPYPTNSDVYAEAIVGCIPYMSDMLVFTETQMYLVKWSADGLSYQSTVVQDKLCLSEFDINTVVTVKNMVYFKNGNYYYMVVPALTTSTKGELVLAPISKNITNFLDYFLTETQRVFEDMYSPTRFARLRLGEKISMVLLDYHTYLDKNDIRNVYSFRVDAGNNAICTFDFVLNYNSVLRTWNTYIVQTSGQYIMPYRQTVTDNTYFIHTKRSLDTITLETGDDENPGEQITKLVHSTTFELVKYDVLNIKDSADLGEVRLLKNWQYADTGHREQNSSTKKRYRELQFKINNIDQSTMEFGIGFFVDDDTRKPLYKYTPQVYTTDPNDELFGWIYMERDFAEPVVASGVTILEDPDDPDMPYPAVASTMGELLESNRWVLDYSKLSNSVMATVRVPVSGKGYAPRLQFLSFNEKRYELLNLNWVYRNMNAR